MPDNKLNMVPVSSRLIRGYVWKEDTSTLTIYFRDGQADYKISKQMFQAFKDSDSKGTFWNHNLKVAKSS
jgi:KTSC domain